MQWVLNPTAQIMSESSTMSKSDHIGAYLDVLLKANTKIAEEMRMNEAKAFYEMLERTGVVADFEARLAKNNE
ncbi:MAG: hypothetical protein Ta2F_03260 [Termitinemataceae bacterium]|nr:MAG: hypothetical protein Ta2F_03260 [Termitinemataceae bacterium]